MTFREHYEKVKSQPLISPGRAFIKEIATETNRSEKTVQQWLSGCHEPPTDIKVKISNLIQIPVEELFPAI